MPCKFRLCSWNIKIKAFSEKGETECMGGSVGHYWASVVSLNQSIWARLYCKGWNVWAQWPDHILCVIKKKAIPSLRADVLQKCVIDRSLSHTHTYTHKKILSTQWELSSPGSEWTSFCNCQWEFSSCVCDAVSLKCIFKKFASVLDIIIIIIMHIFSNIIFKLK